MRNPCKLKVGCCAAHLVGINYYLYPFSGAKTSYMIGKTELNEKNLRSIPNGWINQAYVQGFYCETISFFICKYFWTHRNCGNNL